MIDFERVTKVFAAFDYRWLWPSACDKSFLRRELHGYLRGSGAEAGDQALDNGLGKRRHKRIKMVLPLRIWAKDAANKPFNELAHTLDITPVGARLGAVHHNLKPGDRLLIQYRQRKIHFRVIWVRPMEGTSEFQVGVESIGGETWGLELNNTDQIDVMQVETTVS